MDKAHLCESLMKWLQTFDLDAPHKTLEEISDGVAMAQALTQIAPEWFGESWMSKIKTDAGNNWRLKVSNLKKIVQGIVDYYQECLNQHLTDFNRPDVGEIGEKCNPEELGRLLQLILGCAINCHRKQDYITRIMSMEESVQQVIMQSIQELDRSSMGSSATSIILGSGPETDPQLQRILGELEAATEARDQMAQRCHELDMQVTVLQEEKASVVLENLKLQDRLRQFEALEDPGTSTIHRYKETRKQLDACKEKIFRIETSRDDYRMKVEMQEKELLELHSKLEELQKMADEARHLKDEVDILRETADKAVKYEATIASYKKKLEEYGDLKRQMKILEDKNTDYMQQNMELEEELKKSGTWKPQLELYKKQIAELHQRLSEETKRADKNDFECKNMQEKLSAIQREKERLIIERDSLKETNEELKCSQFAGGSCMSGTTLLAETVSENMIPSEIRERLMRLQHENKMLRMNQRGPDDDKLSMVQALLDESTQRVNHLCMENRLANQKILELEKEVQEGGGAGLRQRLTDLQGQLHIAQGEKERRVSQLEEREVSIAEHKQKIAALEETLRRKDAEFQALEERYRKYIEKAKSVIKTLDPKQNPGSAEAAVLRSQLLEKHKLIEDLEEEKEHTRAFHEMEEKLMVAAFYKLSTVRQREALDNRLAALSSGQGQSFLARQRQATRRTTQHQHFDSR
ncbi:Hook-like protein 3 [Cryptotermes secundus]|uniref:Protein hook n=1 Tax=Cryptotermes secundus TaxID=105785 RepID=A0A2J7R974_9NEOP|nr:protein Hook homolog 3 [Cryptotermes secundus]PNF37389.1 Hook-like protein 3 [Cryptotermes secundus]